MSEVNYISPSSLLPRTNEIQVPAFLQGMQYAGQRQDYDKVRDLSNLMTQMGIQKSSEENVLGAPVRASQRLADIATNQATAGTIGDLKRGQADMAFASGNVARRTMDSDVAIKIAKNVVEQGQAGVQQLQNSIKFAQLVGDGQLQGPQAAAQVQQLAQQFKLPMDSPIVAMALRDPKKATEFLLSINEQVQGTIMTNTAKEKDQTTREREIHNLDNASREKIARIHAAATTALASGDKRTVSQLIAGLEMELRKYLEKGETPPPALIDSLNRLRQDIITGKQAGAVQQQAGTSAITQIPVPAQTPFQPIPGGSQTPASAPTQFKSMEEAQAAIKAGKIKKNTTITINGRPFKAE